VLKDQGQDQNIINYFQQYSDDKLTPKFNTEYTSKDKNGQDIIVKNFSEITFSKERGGDEVSENIKISKGEESNFIWSIFYNLIDLVIGVRNIPELEDRDTDIFDGLEYIFIDDPVSSLDENHLIQLAISLGQLIKSSDYTNGQGIKFIISTHNPLFYNVLYNEVKAKSGYILSRFDDGSFALEEKKGDSNRSFSYHLHIKKLISTAIGESASENNAQRYHFALLRNLYEKTAAFLGYKEWSDLLPGDQKAYANRVMNLYTHNTLSTEEIAEPTAPEKEMIRVLLENLNNYGYWQQELTDAE